MNSSYMKLKCQIPFNGYIYITFTENFKVYTSSFSTWDEKYMDCVSVIMETLQVLNINFNYMFNVTK